MTPDAWAKRDTERFLRLLAECRAELVLIRKQLEYQEQKEEEEEDGED